MKRKQLEKFGIYFGISAVILLVTGIFALLSNETLDIKLENEDKEEKSKLHKGLEISLVILVIILVILGLFIGFRKMQLTEQEANKKRYLRVVEQKDDEYKLAYGGRLYYLKKGDLK